MTDEQGRSRDRWAVISGSVWTALIGLGYLGLWRARQYNLDNGPPCASRGKWDCFLPPPLQALLWVVITVPYFAVASLIWIGLRRRAPKSGAALVLCVFAAWVAHYVIVFQSVLHYP